MAFFSAASWGRAMTSTLAVTAPTASASSAWNLLLMPGIRSLESVMIMPVAATVQNMTEPRKALTRPRRTAGTRSISQPKTYST